MWQLFSSVQTACRQQAPLYLYLLSTQNTFHLTHWVKARLSQAFFLSFLSFFLSFFSFSSSFHFHIKRRLDEGGQASINATSGVWRKISPPSFINLQDIKARAEQSRGVGWREWKGQGGHTNKTHTQTESIALKP